MRNKKKYLNWSASTVTYGAYVNAWVARLTSLGYTVPNGTRLTALDAMITSIGSTAMAKMDNFYIFAWNDTNLQNAASVNIITPASFQASYVNTPGYATNGVMGNGSTSYVDLNYNPATQAVQYTLNAASRFFYVETVPTLGTSMEGNIATNGRNLTVYNASSATNRINSGGNDLNAVVDTTGTGYKAINRSTSTNVEMYNETTKSDRTQSAVAILTGNQSLGKVGTTFSNTRFGMYGMGTSLSQAEHTAIRSAYLAFKTAIGL